MTAFSTQIDLENPSTGDLLRNLAGILRAQPDETAAEYKARFTAATAAWASFGPRDAMERLMHQLERLQKRPLETLVQPVVADIVPIPPPRPRVRVGKPALMLTPREKGAPPQKSPGELSDEELAEAAEAGKYQFFTALFNANDPNHREAVSYLPDIVPGVIVPAHLLEDRSLNSA